MNLLFMTGPIALTSVVAYLVARRALGLSPSQLGTALTRTLECLGAWLIFFALNLAVGMAAILAVRVFTGAFVSLYVVADATVALLSFLQALAFEWWRETGRTATSRR